MPDKEHKTLGELRQRAKTEGETYEKKVASRVRAWGFLLVVVMTLTGLVLLATGEYSSAEGADDGEDIEVGEVVIMTVHKTAGDSAYFSAARGAELRWRGATNCIGVDLNRGPTKEVCPGGGFDLKSHLDGRPLTDLRIRTLGPETIEVYGIAPRQ